MDELVRVVQERQHRVLQFGALAVGGLVGFAESRGDQLVAVLLYALTPLVCLGLVVLWGLDVRRLTSAATAPTAPEAKPASAYPVDFLRREVHYATRGISLVAGAAFLAAAFSLVLGARELAGIEGRAGYHTIAMIVYCVYGTLTLAAIGVAGTGDRQRGTRMGWGVAVCVLGLAITVVAGFVYDPQPRNAAGHAGRASPSPSPPVQTRPLGRYVALGDSYAAGEGVRPYDPLTNDPSKGGNDCHRSEAAYARLLIVGKPWTIDFRACSGSRIPHVFDEPQRDATAGGHAPIGVQVPPGTLGADVRLVTISIGGNDLGFADLLVRCSSTSNCFESPRPFRDGLSPVEWVEREMAAIPDRLDAVYTGLRAEAPDARILVLGYPYLFPDRMSSNLTCQTMRIAWESAERETIRAYGARVNEIIREAVTPAAEYVDLATPFAGHEQCGPDEDWVQRPTILAVDQQIRRGLFHPNAAGQQAMARAVTCHLFVFPDPPAEDEPTSAHTEETGGAPALDACVAAGG